MENRKNFEKAVKPDRNKVTLLQEEVASYIMDSTEKLYNLDVNNDSLFMVTRFSSPKFYGETDDGKLDEAKISCFMLQKYSFSDPTCNFTVSPETNIPAFKNITKVNELNLTFIDSSQQDFQRYHYEWVGYWYDRLNDRMVNGIRGKFRNLEIVRFKFIRPSSAFTLDGEYSLKDNIWITSFITVTGMCPANIIMPKGDSSSSNTLPSNSYKYKIQSASISYLPMPDELFYNPDTYSGKIYNPKIDTYFF